MWHAWEIIMYIVWWEHLKERDCFGNLCVDRQIILKWEELLMLIGWATAVLVMNMADPLSAD
jgi:hypothetical protein